MATEREDMTPTRDSRGRFTRTRFNRPPTVSRATAPRPSSTISEQQDDHNRVDTVESSAGPLFVECTCGARLAMLPVWDTANADLAWMRHLTSTMHSA